MADISQHPHKLFGLINLEELYNSNPDAIIINDGSFLDQAQSKVFTEHLLSDIDGVLGYSPTCKCGNTSGLTREGETCPICHTVCSTKFVDTLQHNVWISIPDYMPKVLHPTWYLILAEFGSPKAYNTRTNTHANTPFIEACLDPAIDVSKYAPELQAVFGDDPVNNRGFKWLSENMDKVIDAIVTHCTLKPHLNPAKAAKGIGLRKLYDTYRDTVFTSKIPILHSSLHTIKSSGDNRYDIDKVSHGVMAAATDLMMDELHVYRKNRPYKNTKRQKESLFRIYKYIIEYAESIVSTKIGSKKSLIRQHCLGSRLNFTFRSVIVAQDDILPFDEILVPWGIMVNMFKLVILNMLTSKYGLTASAALDQWQMALTHYDRQVDDCLRAYINQHKDHKLTILLGRNPTLAYGSEMKLFVRNYKTDPHDETIALNACIVEPMNAGMTVMHDRSSVCSA